MEIDRKERSARVIFLFRFPVIFFPLLAFSPGHSSLVTRRFFVVTSSHSLPAEAGGK